MLIVTDGTIAAGAGAVVAAIGAVGSIGAAVGRIESIVGARADFLCTTIDNFIANFLAACNERTAFAVATARDITIKVSRVSRIQTAF